MIELSSLLKIAPIAGAIVIAALSFGELRADVRSLQTQVTTMQVQLNQIQNILEKMSIAGISLGLDLLHG